MLRWILLLGNLFLLRQLQPLEGADMRTRTILSFFSVALGVALVSVPGFCDSVGALPTGRNMANVSGLGEEGRPGGQGI